MIRGYSFRINLLLLIGIVSVSHVNVWAKEKTQGNDIEHSQKMVEQWLSVERQTSALEKDWINQKPIIEQRLLLLAAEKQQLQQLLNDKSTDVSDVEQKRLDLVNEQTTLEVVQNEMDRSLSQIKNQIVTLKPYLAPPILNAWQSNEAQTTDVKDTSQILQISLTQLTKLIEFDQRVSVIQAPIKNSVGESILVKQLFLGASNAWFVSLDGSYVGKGYADENGWQWIFKNNLDSKSVDEQRLDSKDVSLAIAMFEKKTEADFVQLPLVLNQKEVN